MLRKLFSRVPTAEMINSWKTATEPFTRREVRFVRKEVEQFLETLPINTVTHSRVKFGKFYGFVDGSIRSIQRDVVLEKGILTSSDYKKVVDKGGKTVFFDVFGEGTHTKMPMIHESKTLESWGIKADEMQNMTKAERLAYAKFLAAHEDFHLYQLSNMACHPEIGYEKVAEMIKPRKNSAFTEGQIDKCLSQEKNPFIRLALKLGKKYWYNKLTNRLQNLFYWCNKRKLTHAPKLDPHSEIAKQTMEEYNFHQSFIEALTKDAEKVELYNENPLELHAYQFGERINNERNIIT